MKRFVLSLLLLASLTVAHGQQLILGGELSNSAATCVEDIDEVMPRMAALGLNTVLVPAYWELMEPEEGRFDFTLIDRTIQRAQENHLHVVFLWFGVWKNSMSCYAPLWFKQDTRRFPRARTASGKPLEIASAFSDQVLQADLRAFTALMQHIRQTDTQGTVAMMQIENEIGMLEDARDHSPLAEKAYQQGVPQRLADYLKKNKRRLHPWLQARIQDLTPGAPWTSAFGTDTYTDEIFMAYHYACYVEHLAQAARQAMPQMPLYVNAAMNSRGRRPGEYPSAGPLAHLIDLWHCGAPTLDLLAPDIYDTGFKQWAAQYALWNNRLFIPESRCCQNSGVRALYAFGEHQALGFSPFAIDQASPQETQSITRAYALMRQLTHHPSLTTHHSSLITHHSSLITHHSPLPTWGLLFDQEDRERIIQDGDLVLTCRHYFTLPWDPRATDGTTWPEGGAIVVRLNRHEYLFAGSGVVVSFATKSEKEQEQQKTLGEDGFAEQGTGQHSAAAARFRGSRIGIGFVDEVSIDADGIHRLRRHNGDQDHQGRHARIAVGDWKILHVSLYEYE